MNQIIDFHSHVLPGVDDGSRSIDESIAMLRMEADQGIRTVIATPHFYPRHDNPERFLARRDAAKEQLLQHIYDHTGLPQIICGAEVYYFSGISESDILSQLTIGNTKYILIEMPGSPWTDSMYRDLEAISYKRGLIPVIAHVDRYFTPLRTYGIPEHLSKLPVLVQANASFFIQRNTRGKALRMLEKGQIHLLGSDAHNTADRAPKLGAALQMIDNQLGKDAINHIQYHQALVFPAK